MTSMMGNSGFSGQRGPTGKVGNTKMPSGYRSGQQSQYTPEQNQLFQQGFGAVAPDSYTSRLAGGDQSMFEEMEAPALRQFNELQGGLASRFSGGSGKGSLGTRRSSGFQNESTSAASNFAQQLQSQRQGLQRQAIQDLQSMSHQLLGERPYAQWMTQKRQKEQGGWGGPIGAGVGAVGGFFAGGGNPATALSGAQLGYNVGSQF